MPDGAVTRANANLSSTLPLIGGWIRKRAVNDLFALAQTGRVDALQCLIEAVSCSGFEDVRAAASHSLTGLKNRACIDHLCQTWADSRSPVLERLLVEAGYVGGLTPESRMLAALKVRNDEAVCDLVRQSVALLQRATADRDAAIGEYATFSIYHLKTPGAVDALCAAWEGARDPILEDAIATAMYVASNPPYLRVLTALKAGRLSAIKDVGRQAVALLLIARRDRDAEIVALADEALTSLASREAVDEVCDRWADSRDVYLESVISRGRYGGGTTPAGRMLVALKTGNEAGVNSFGRDTYRLLLGAMEDRDRGIADNARRMFSSLRDQDAIDALCERWAETRDPLFERAVVQGRYVAGQPYRLRVTTALKVRSGQALLPRSTQWLPELIAALGDQDTDIAAYAGQLLLTIEDPTTVDLLFRKLFEAWDSRLYDLVAGSKYESAGSHGRILGALRRGTLSSGHVRSLQDAQLVYEALFCPDTTVSRGAWNALSGMKNQYIEELLDDKFERVIEGDDPGFLKIALQYDLSPCGEEDKAIFYVIHGLWDKYEALDFMEGRPVLKRAYSAAKPEIRKRMLASAKRSGRSWLIGETVVDLGRQLKAEDVSDDEWETVIAGLTTSGDYERLWQLMFIVPLRFVGSIVISLKNSGWQPPEHDADIFAQLIADYMKITGGKDVVVALEIADETAYYEIPGKYWNDINTVVSLSEENKLTGSAGKHSVAYWGYMDEEQAGKEHTYYFSTALAHAMPQDLDELQDSMKEDTEDQEILKKRFAKTLLMAKFRHNIGVEDARAQNVGEFDIDLSD